MKNGCDNTKYDQYVQNALRLPINVYDAPPQDRLSMLKRAREIMDEEIHGQPHLKGETLRALCSWATNPQSGGINLALVGEPGVGKTSYANALGKIMNRPICHIRLGGLNDVSVLCGHSYSYESSHFGQIAQCLMECNSSSPVVVFDEVDKLGESPKAQEIVSLLVHLTDPASNHNLNVDRYFQLPFDLSRACFVFTMNDSTRVSNVLMDRLTTIRMETPSIDDRVSIATNFLIPREFKRVNLTNVHFQQQAIREMASCVKESGVRAMARIIRLVVETLNVQRVNQDGALDQNITLETVNKIVKASPFDNPNASVLTTLMYC